MKRTTNARIQRLYRDLRERAEHLRESTRASTRGMTPRSARNTVGLWRYRVVATGPVAFVTTSAVSRLPEQEVPAWLR